MSNRVRAIIRSCICARRGPGIDGCLLSDRARTRSCCEWRASLMHPLDEPSFLQARVPIDTPDKYQARGQAVSTEDDAAIDGTIVYGVDDPPFSEPVEAS